MKYISDGSKTELSNEEIRALIGFDLERALLDKEVMAEYNKLIPSFVSKFRSDNGFKREVHQGKIAWAKRMALLSMIQKSLDKEREIESIYGSRNKAKPEFEIIDCTIGRLPDNVTEEQYNSCMPKHLR